jgi:DNA (cytosine-5)-methyltransferase 1
MKILNLYAGIGGNRKLWGSQNVTAVEFDKDIAAVYKKLYPDDTVIIGDAHEYLEKNYKEFDFIWSSPPCPSHSKMRQGMQVKRGKSKAVYPDMRLYQEIIFLKHNFEGKWIVENVKPYYEPLLIPTFEMERHFWWCNFNVEERKFNHDMKNIIKKGTVEDLQERHQTDLSKFNIKNKRQILRNCVYPPVGKHILDCAQKNT